MIPLPSEPDPAVVAPVRPPGSTLLGVSLRIAIASLFAAGPRLFIDVELHGLEHDTRAPSTYFAISHKRDLDSIAPLPAIVWHGGWRRVVRDLHFAMRADGFEPGFLSRVVRQPLWLSRSLHWLAVGPILHLVGDHPLMGFQARPAESWLRDVLQGEGDLPGGAVLSSVALQALATAVGEPVARLADLPLSRLLSWRYTHHLPLLCGPDLLADEVRRRAERRAIEAAKARLADAAAWLTRGGSLYSAPEGRFSPDGRLCPVTSGFHRLLRAAPEQTQIVPVAIAYDFMTTHRMRMFVDLAPPIPRANTLPRRDLDAQLHESWLRAARFTCTQLGAAFLVERTRAARPTFTRDELASALAGQAQHLASSGRHVDARLLMATGARRLAAGFLRYCIRRGYAQPTRLDGQWRAVPGELEISVAPGEVGYPSLPLAYAWNECRELLSIGESVEAPARGTTTEPPREDQMGA